MGLLDDAIREHLELKRRRGASDDEVSSQEHEAFGAGAVAPAEPVAEVPAAAAPVAEPEPDAAPDAEPEPAAPPEPVAPVAEPAAAVAESEFWLDDPDEVPAEESLDHHRAQPTHEFTPEGVEELEPEAEFVAPDEEPGGEDPLEETPEFLQETPEHDRLWFEQKPPKDFDFGG
jgi:hypothetical protein